MRSTHKLSDGTKLMTSSSCRFVTFTVSDDSVARVAKRSDNPATADLNHRHFAGRGYCRVVTVDFRSRMTDGKWVTKACWDTADNVRSAG